MRTFNAVIGRHCFRVSIAALALVGAAHVASAQLVDVNFGYSPASGAAVVGNAGDTWNGIDNGVSGGPFSLVDANNNPTSISLTYDTSTLNPLNGGVVSSSIVGTQPNPSLMNTYLFNNVGGTITVTLGGLVPNTLYNIYVYLASDDASGNDRSARVASNSATGTPPYGSATGNPQSSFIYGQNYVLLPASYSLSSASGTLQIYEFNRLLGPGGDNGEPNTSGEVDMNGLQIEPVAVPEPTTVIAGALMLLPFGASALQTLRKSRTA